MLIDFCYGLSLPTLRQAIFDRFQIVRVQSQQARTFTPATLVGLCAVPDDVILNVGPYRGTERVLAAVNTLCAEPVSTCLIVGDKIVAQRALAMHFGRELSGGGHR